MSELENLSWDIILFIEMRSLDTPQLLDNSHKLYSASARGHASGVAILVASKHVQSVRGIHRISDRVVALDVCLHSRLSRVVAVYLPHSGYSLAEIDEVYQQISPLIRQAQSRHMQIIIGGDFNTTLDHSPQSLVFSDWIAEFDLQLCNDPSLLDFDSSWTYSHPLTGKCTLDYILTSRHFSIFSAFATSDLGLGSGHRAVIANLTSRQSRARR